MSNNADLEKEINPEIILDVKDPKDRGKIISVMKQSSCSCPTMLGIALMEKQLLESLVAADPNFLKRAGDILLKEAEIHIQKEKALAELMEEEPKLAKEDIDFSKRGQWFACILAISGIALAGFMVYKGAFTEAVYAIGCSLAPGLFSAYINRSNPKKELQDNAKSIQPKKKK
ncbi:MAG: hypothetical protein RR203_02405 [Synergistaceae bacterium]